MEMAMSTSTSGKSAGNHQSQSGPSRHGSIRTDNPGHSGACGGPLLNQPLIRIRLQTVRRQKKQREPVRALFHPPVRQPACAWNAGPHEASFAPGPGFYHALQKFQKNGRDETLFKNHKTQVALVCYGGKHSAAKPLAGLFHCRSFAFFALDSVVTRLNPTKGCIRSG